MHRIADNYYYKVSRLKEEIKYQQKVLTQKTLKTC